MHWKKTCHSNIPNPERKKQTTFKPKNSLRIWFSRSRSFLSPKSWLPSSEKNLPGRPENALQKSPGGATRNVRSSDLAGCSVLGKSLSGGCCYLFNWRWQWKSIVELFECLWLSTKNWFGDFLLLHQIPGGVQPTFFNEMARESPVLQNTKQPRMVGNCLSQSPILEVNFWE